MQASDLKVVFMATGDIALPAFRHLLKHGPKPLALVTQPDKPVGRKQVLTPPKIKTEALAAGVPVFQPEKVGDAAEEISALEPDVIVVMAYGQILRQNVLAIAKLAIINLHASLLPKYRGASCIQAAIAAGDKETGITAMHVVRELDAGDIIHAQAIPILPDDTGGSLHDRLADLAPSVLQKTLSLLASGNAPRTPQDPAQVSYIGKLTREDGKIDWSRPAEEIARQIRAYEPWPGSFFHAELAGKPTRVKLFSPVIVLQAEGKPGFLYREGGCIAIGCGAGSLQIEQIQPEGKRVMNVHDLLRGCDISIV